MFDSDNDEEQFLDSDNDEEQFFDSDDNEYNDDFAQNIDNRKKYYDINTELLSRAQFLFKDSIWSYRCTKFAEFELSYGISHVNKVHPPSSATSSRSSSSLIHPSNDSR